MTPPIRGQVYRVDLGHGPKPWVIVSNNVRNRQLDDVLAARITTTDKPVLPTVVRLSSADQPLVGSILADDIVQLYRDELATPVGALSPQTLMKLNSALAIALALPMSSA
ncbi:type II toxin-antitoxin system PemK/MazF family toxin [Solihabitans fulvus]|uniref:Type II toxin-antitoxin system PemK/MazF family toxin n=1 Tax=Solihabitans fulvus TaxID=1892852 RepID=A0A5B2XQA1_9PSEU|nr:type II toxin-antitoxin system PemK/MazF family toxin [Solihabitans fulvus]KAA2266108.1 type II toxin-antitoxin system PemK/MazF family toxin [Solihabitans fulvus]